MATWWWCRPNPPSIASDANGTARALRRSQRCQGSSGASSATTRCPPATSSAGRAPIRRPNQPAAGAATAKQSTGSVVTRLTRDGARPRSARIRGSTGETAGFQNAKDKFEAANPGAKVTFKVVPYDGFFAGIDRGLQSNTAPDVFRVDYTTIGKYSSKDVLLDMTPYFTTDEIDAFLPALWEGIKFSGVPYGVPHQTDTSCIVYDKDLLAAAGITTVPDSLDNAWTWEEFADVAKKLRSSLPATKFPFAYNWTQAGAYRVVAFCDARNAPVARLLRRVGMRQESSQVEADYFKGEWTTLDGYAVLAREYVAR